MLRKKSSTCLAVVREKGTKKKRGKLVFAGDRRISWGMGQHQIATRAKVIKRNGVVFAGTGVSYLCDLVCELCEVPDVPEQMDGFNYVHHVLYRNIMAILTEKGCMDKEGKVTLSEDFEAVILVGFKGDLFEICISNDCGVTIDAIDAPYAHGCGGKYALGSLKTTENSKMSAEDRLKLALGIAAELSPGCDANVDIVREDDKDVD
jgi:hypothetical protein